GVSQDAKKSDEMAYYMMQGGLGLPNRDYYFNTDERTTKIREAYPGYISSVLTLVGTDGEQAKAKAAAIIAMETKLAQSSRKLEDLRDPYANYNKVAIGQMQAKMSPGIDWPVYMKEMGVKNVDSVIVGQPEFFQQLAKVVTTEDMQTLKD